MEELVIKYGLKIVGGLLLMLFLSGAAFGVYKHIELRGEKIMLEQQKKADAEEHQRRLTTLEQTQAQFAQVVETLKLAEKTNATLLERNDRASAANDGRSCHDTAAADRLRAAGASGRKARIGTGEPAGKAAR